MCNPSFAVLTAALLASGVSGTQSRGTAPAAHRRALVVGNDAYANAPLKNAHNDAAMMARVLGDLGFAVTRIEDASHERFVQALSAFSADLGPTDLALFYYAGHGVQVESENFLVPVDLALGSSDAVVRAGAVRASDIQAALRRAQVSVIVLDACRTNPFASARSGANGLAEMDAQGSLVAYATGANQTASDNPSGINGLFTGELARLLMTPGLSLREVFYQARQRVHSLSGGRQFPAIYDQLLHDLVLRPAPINAHGSSSQQPAERELWDLIKTASDPSLFDQFVARYPESEFRLLAEARSDALRSYLPDVSAPSRPLIRGDSRGLGIQWARIPAGTFEMGCADGPLCPKNELPRHTVLLTRAFDLMRSEVTLGMYRVYAWATWRVVPVQPKWNLDPQQPVVNVTWDEASKFCSWLGGRLPTEAEWERAARGSSPPTLYPWGNESPVAALGSTNGARFGTTGTALVATFGPTSLGLFDLSGNVAEWVADWSGAYPDVAVGDPTGPRKPDGLGRMVRGGSWISDPQGLRASARSAVLPAMRQTTTGIRCAANVSQ